MSEDSSISGMAADIEITTTLPTPHEERERVNTAVLRVLRAFGPRYVVDWQDRWTGWAYKGRPPGAPRLVSHDAWRAKATVTTTGSVLHVSNQARDWRTKSRDYVAHVHRAGGKRPEWLRVRDMQAQTGDIDEQLIDAVTDAVLRGGTGPKSRKLTQGTGGMMNVAPAMDL